MADADVDAFLVEDCRNSVVQWGGGGTGPWIRVVCPESEPVPDALNITEIIPLFFFFFPQVGEESADYLSAAKGRRCLPSELQ